MQNAKWKDGKDAKMPKMEKIEKPKELEKRQFILTTERMFAIL